MSFIFLKCKRENLTWLLLLNLPHHLFWGIFKITFVHICLSIQARPAIAPHLQPLRQLSQNYPAQPISQVVMLHLMMFVCSLLSIRGQQGSPVLILTMQVFYGVPLQEILKRTRNGEIVPVNVEVVINVQYLDT